MGKKPSVSCETITTISYISRMLTNRMISINSGSCFATQQLRLWHTSISCSWPTAYLFWVLRDKNWKRRPFFLSHKFLHVSCLISMWYKFFVAFKDHVIWHTFSRFKAMCHITCMPFDLRQNHVISQTRMNWNLSIACTNLWLLTSSYFWGILNYLMFLLFLLFPNSDVNYFLKLKLNWNLDRTHKSVITD